MQSNHLVQTLEHVWKSERQLADAFFVIAGQADNSLELQRGLTLFAHWSSGHAINLDGFIVNYGGTLTSEPVAAHVAPFPSRASGNVSYNDLQELLLLAQQTRSAWTTLADAVKETYDPGLSTTILRCTMENDRQIFWLKSHLENISPQIEIDRSAWTRRPAQGEQTSQSS